MASTKILAESSLQLISLSHLPPYLRTYKPKCWINPFHSRNVESLGTETFYSQLNIEINFSSLYASVKKSIKWYFRFYKNNKIINEFLNKYIYPVICFKKACQHANLPKEKYNEYKFTQKKNIMKII